MEFLNHCSSLCASPFEAFIRKRRMSSGCSHLQSLGTLLIWNVVCIRAGEYGFWVFETFSTAGF